MRTFFACLAAVFVLLQVWPVAAQEAGRRVEYTGNGWTVERITPPGGAGRCDMRRWQGTSLLAVAWAAESLPRYLFSDAGWDMGEMQEIAVVLRLDDEVRQLRARVLDGAIELRLREPTRVGLLGEMMAAEVLILEEYHEEDPLLARFGLAGAEAAVEALIACWAAL